MITDDPKQAVAGVDFVHTDVWVSMGEAKEVWAERIMVLKPYQVDLKLMQATRNPLLPAFHNLDTKVGREIHEQFGLTAMEVTEEVFESEINIAFERGESDAHHKGDTRRNPRRLKSCGSSWLSAAMLCCGVASR